MEELARYEPDLFIILDGHNEFLEHRTYSGIIALPKPVRGLASLAHRTRLSAVARAAAEKLKPSSPVPARHVFSDEVNTMLERVEGPEAYRRDDDLRARIVDHFKFNLSRMADIAHSAGAKVVLVTPASNLRDCSPFKSENRAGISDTELRSWQSTVTQATSLLASSNWNGALSALDAAAKIDPRYAQTHYLRGRVLWELGRFKEAKSAFLRAMDEDVCPVRALTPIVDAVTEVAAQRSLPQVDFVKLLDGLAEHGTPGDDWFLDHVHPTIEGHRRLALALIEEMARMRVVQPAAAWNDAAADKIKLSLEQRLDAKAHGTALCNVAKVMAWAGKYQEAYRMSLRAKALSPDDAAIQFEVGKNAGHLRLTDESIAHLESALRLNPRFVEARVVLASTFAARGDVARAINESRTAMQLRPDFPELRSNLGAFLSRAGQDGEAEVQFREAIRLAPEYAEAHANLASLLLRAGRLTEALQQFDATVRLKPGLVAPQLGMAWILATHPDDGVRDPARAIALCEALPPLARNEDWAVLDTLAAAYAAAGRFPDAVRAQQKAISLLRASGAVTSTLEERLTLYENGKPFRTTSR
jgi:tetratricopeptide (TPR) repeat protein